MSFSTLLTQSSELSRQLHALPATDPLRAQLLAQYTTLQEQIRALRNTTRQAWL